MDSPQPPRTPTGHVTLWATMFFDLLGWSTKVLALDEVGEFRADQARVDATVNTPIVDYVRARIAIEKQLETINSSPELEAQRKEWMERLPEPQRGLMKAVIEMPYILRTAGDSFVVSIEIHGDAHHSFAPAALRLRKLIGLAGTAFLLLLAEGVPVRAAIEAGRGTTYDPYGGGPKEFIGASLVHAYRLESRDADYPRILIGPRLYTFLRSMAEETTLPVDVSITQPVARNVLELLRGESDGSVSVDYLHPEMLELAGGQAKEKAMEAYRFVSKSFGEANAANNSRLVGMHGLTYRYFWERLGPLNASTGAPGARSDRPTGDPTRTPSPGPATPEPRST